METVVLAYWYIWYIYKTVFLLFILI